MKIGKAAGINWKITRKITSCRVKLSAKKRGSFALAGEPK
jgi:hypothetical protein